MSGPGGYQHNRDPQLAELLHQVTEQGWGNDSAGDLAEDGFHASLLIVEPAEQEELSEAFDRDVPAGNWILTQGHQGFVTLDEYPTPASARYAFDHLPDLDRPGEEDGTITLAGPLGSQYAVAMAGSFLGYADDLDQATAMLRGAMDADRYWPDAWFISDHGNPTASASGRDHARDRRTPALPSGRHCWSARRPANPYRPRGCRLPDESSSGGRSQPADWSGGPASMPPRGPGPAPPVVGCRPPRRVDRRRPAPPEEPR